ncbi:hypothetical protein K1T71_014486 [Dendrolimus kikuchii]|uniref:Uncharacterized protein n=1 Tax=Dendrolimus kikuchii TaxID=765133 RepID=A0ACC1CE48_9NEOP|nr:hypothetical protein K1T71_014486 [Dendrolimus kikuchii]
MTTASLNKFLKALEAVKDDYTCGVCSQFCKDPVTLSKCFHVICSEHFDDLKICPTCDTNLEGGTKFYDASLSTCVDATKELDTFFQNYAMNLSRMSEDPGCANKGKSLSDSSQMAPGTSFGSTKKPTRNSKNAENISIAKKVVSTKVTSTRSKTRTLKPNISTVNANNRLSKRSGNDSSKVEELDNFSGNDKKTSSKDNKLKQTKLIESEPNSQKNTLLDTDYKFKKNKNQNKDTVFNVSKEVEIKPTEQSGSTINISATNTKFNKANEKRNLKGETLLHVACRLGKVEHITELLEQGANTNTKDNAGWTPLHEVVQNGRLDLVRLLLQYNTLIDVPGQSNETPLHEAVRYRHTDIAVELVKNGADIHARNCKGETPYQLASLDMKTTLLAAAEDIIQTQSLNVTHMSLMHSELDFDNIRVYCVSQNPIIHNKLKALAKAHGNLMIDTKFNKKVTHLIVDCEDGVCTSSLTVLQGIVNSLWILNTEWVNKSTDDKLETFESYEVLGVGNKYYNGPKNSRYNKYKQLPGIFDGCYFYLHNFNNKYEISKSLILTKASLSKLITDADGVVLNRVPDPEAIPDQEKLVPYHAKKDGKLVDCSNYIIFKEMYQPMYNMKHLKALPIGWLIECMEKYELCEPWAL